MATDTDIAERLRQYRGKSWETTECYNGVRDEAADLIDDLRRQLSEINPAIKCRSGCAVVKEGFGPPCPPFPYTHKPA